MNSIDNLREWANGLHGVYINQVDHTITVTTGWDAPPDMDSVSLRDHINGILDGIEREVKELTDERDLLKTQWEAGVDFDQRLEAAAAERADVTLFGVDYTALPLDADGVPIHVGDVVVEDGCGVPYKVMSLTLFEDCWDVGGCGMNPNLCHHHHAPTVEDVLREFGKRWDDPAHYAKGELVETFAAKLQLKEG